eukprot:TRINITY_DN9039_c0_g1_i1.p2 TRINITY_DN9039_c0_g1~~TRINITY_DN9039_c0_g1_i1.p2  ORF type:complete len:86 (+),score=26.54 TRINITY_DN9039_c0_g1_i1:155-412(+)
MRLMEQMKQLKIEKESRERLEAASICSEPSIVIQEMEVKLLEKSNQLKGERENRERLEKMVEQLKIELERNTCENKENDVPWPLV